MKTKQLTPREALELLLLTGKPLPLANGSTLHGAAPYLGFCPFYIKNKNSALIEDGDLTFTNVVEIEIPEGRNPDGITLAHLQMGENGQEYRLLDEGEYSEKNTDEIEVWGSMGNSWLKYNSGQNKNVTYRTRKPKGYFLPKKEI
jgi:hypothetical protein